MEFERRLKIYLHDPIDKSLDIPGHEKRARDYAKRLGIDITDVLADRSSDIIASSLERSILPGPEIRQGFTEIIHPLSGEKLKLEGIDKDEVFKFVEKIFDEIACEMQGFDEKKRFFYIWRNLLEALLSAEKEWKKYFPILPADTRVPDHSIWEHLKVASAINASEDLQNNSLFLFSIGPVQGFISQARKAQDFFMGSFILSYLTFIAIKDIVDKYGPTSIIYPDLYKQPLMDWFLEREIKISVKNSVSQLISLPTIPNRFVAIIPETERDKIKELAKKLKNDIENEFSSIINEILTYVEEKQKDFDKKQYEEKIKKQVKDFPEFYWVAVPWRVGQNNIELKDLKDFFNEDDFKKWESLLNIKKDITPFEKIGLLYQALYTVLEKSMRARKNLREFHQFKEAGRKCSICGERNVLFYKGKKKYNEDAVELKDIEPRFLAEGEGLCGLCFIKRTFGVYLEKKFGDIFKNFTFPSVSEIASADFKEDILKSKSTELETYERKVKEVLGIYEVPSIPKLKDQQTIGGEWFYEENLKEDYIMKELGKNVSEKEIKDVKEALRMLIKKTGKEPNPYYAIVHLDGDNMGDWLSGRLLPEIEKSYNSETLEKINPHFIGNLKANRIKKLLTPAIHSFISTSLRNYTIEFVKKIVEEEHLGKLIYAGGDDILAFVNLKSLIDVMEKLRFAFSGHIKFGENGIEIDRENNSGFVQKNGVYISTMGSKATASMGVVIAHYKTPLRLVIEKVFEMAEKAKSNSCKDSFAILLLKRSGEERVAVYRWLYKTNNGEFLPVTFLIRNLGNYLNPEKDYHISHRFIQKLKAEFFRLRNEDGHFSGRGGVFNEELKRLLSRSCMGKDNNEEKKKCVDGCYNVLSNLFWEGGANIDNFANLVEIVSFLDRGE